MSGQGGLTTVRRVGWQTGHKSDCCNTASSQPPTPSQAQQTDMATSSPPAESDPVERPVTERLGDRARQIQMSSVLPSRLGLGADSVAAPSPAPAHGAALFAARNLPGASLGARLMRYIRPECTKRPPITDSSSNAPPRAATAQYPTGAQSNSAMRDMIVPNTKRATVRSGRATMTIARIVDRRASGFNPNG